MICKKTAAGWVIASPDFAGVGDPDCPPRLAHLLGRPFDVNRAQAEDLERLPAIGPETASRIVRAREDAQGFSGLPASLPGVSKRAMESLRRWTEVSVVESVDE